MFASSQHINTFTVFRYEQLQVQYNEVTEHSCSHTAANKYYPNIKQKKCNFTFIILES